MSAVVYAIHTRACTYLLDDDGICRWALDRSGASVTDNAARCVSAQFVACLDLSAPGGLVGALRERTAALFTRDEDGRQVLLRTGLIESVEYRSADEKDEPAALPPPQPVAMTAPPPPAKPMSAPVAMTPPPPPVKPIAAPESAKAPAAMGPAPAARPPVKPAGPVTAKRLPGPPPRPGSERVGVEVGPTTPAPPRPRVIVNTASMGLPSPPAASVPGVPVDPDGAPSPRVTLLGGRAVLPSEVEIDDAEIEELASYTEITVAVPLFRPPPSPTKVDTAPRWKRITGGLRTPPLGTAGPPPVPGAPGRRGR